MVIYSLYKKTYDKIFIYKVKKEVQVMEKRADLIAYISIYY